MNNLELHAVFQEEEYALKQAFKNHGLTREDPDRQWINDASSFEVDVAELPDQKLREKLVEHLKSGAKTDNKPCDAMARALHYCFMTGKKASMRLLLGAGVNNGWTPDQVSLALGDVPEMPQTADADPFCFACHVGNIDAARAYLDKFDSGRNRCSEAVIAAVRARATDIVKWLMDLGFDPNAVDDIKYEALERAVEKEDIATADVLLAAGAAPYGSQKKPYTSPVETAVSDDMRRLFVRYGINPAHFDYGPSLENPNLKRLPEITLTRTDFETHRTNRAGNSNPERFLPAFWSEQMRDSQYAKLEALGYEPDEDKPVWFFERFGRSATVLPDGRLVLVAGEHEDYYDADFCIYADVTVLGCDGEVDHFIYPREVFPPTDFHSATLVGEEIWLIGCLGYPNQRKESQTQVLRLSTINFSISPVPTFGTPPGWIHNHKATLTADGILISGGKIEPGYVDNKTNFMLDLESLEWRELS